MKEYYIVSLKHTSKADSALTLWKGNERGYTWFQELAGVYREDQLPALDTSSKAIEKSEADKFFTPTVYDGSARMALKNNIVVLDALGLDYGKMKPKSYRSCHLSF